MGKLKYRKFNENNHCIYWFISINLQFTGQRIAT